MLASSSRYRAEQLSALGLQFGQIAPEVDESALAGEPPDALARRLAGLKTQAAAARCPDTHALFIGSDQVASVSTPTGVRILGKPGTLARAREQLQLCSGREVRFHTAVAVLDRRVGAADPAIEVDETRVTFRSLEPALIEHYLALEAPLDCAGSFRSERLGRLLFERVRTDDPDALVGLPVLALARLLRNAGVDLLACSDFSLPAHP